MNKLNALRWSGFPITFLCIALAACGGSDGDAVEDYQLQISSLEVWEDNYPTGEGAPACQETVVLISVKRRGERVLPEDFTVSRVTLSRADGSLPWSPQLDPRRTDPPGLARLQWDGVAVGCSANRDTGERFNAFPVRSLATVTMQVSAGGLRGQLQERDVYINGL